MPTATEILRQLQAISQEAWWVALAAHIAVIVLIDAVTSGWRPRGRTAGLVLSAPAATVSACAIAAGNWFNAASFAALATIVATSGVMDARRIDVAGRGWRPIVGGALIAFGFVYPHFVEGPWFRALYAAPLGIVPCPTLAVIAGFVVLGFRPRSHVAAIAVAAWAAFYAIVGVARLGVSLDLGLAIVPLAVLVRIDRPVLGIRGTTSGPFRSGALPR